MKVRNDDRTMRGLRATMEALDNRSHAQTLAPLGHTLFIWLMTLDGELWSSRGGANSWRFWTNGHQYCLKGLTGRKPMIEVRHYAQGGVIRVLRTRMEVQRWVRSLAPAQALKVAA